MFRKLIFTAIAASSLCLTSCAGAAISSTTLAVKGSQRDDLYPAAAAGDPAAQTALGQSWCCMGPGFDTQKATEWLCKAARQDYAEAQYELGRIYLGDVSRTPAPGQKVMKLARAKKNEAAALMWLERAAAGGHVDAAEKAAALAAGVSEVDRASADALASSWDAAPCTYAEVFAP